MARMPRVVVPHYPHHVTQRGNRRQTTFFLEKDYQAYLDLLVENKTKVGVDVWAYCLMPNHVHMVLVQEQPDSLARLFRVAHGEYTRRVNFREEWRGHVWQEMVVSCTVDLFHGSVTVVDCDHDGRLSVKAVNYFQHLGSNTTA